MEATVTTVTTAALTEAEKGFREALETRSRQLETTKREILALATATAEAGSFALEMQTIVGASRFDLWFAGRDFACTLREAKGFIRFSQRRAEVSDSFRRQLLSLPEITDGHDKRGPEVRHLSQGEANWLNSVMKAVEAVSLAIERTPVEKWPEAHRITLIDSLRPLAEIYEKWRDRD